MLDPATRLKCTAVYINRKTARVLEGLVVDGGGQVERVVSSQTRLRGPVVDG
jgi:hypothetical protein